MPDGEISPFLIFTDAAYENRLATRGIVVIDSTTGTRTAMRGNIPKMMEGVRHDLGIQQVITLAEAFTALLARVSVLRLITRRRVIFWIDNEGARYSLIKGISQTLSPLQIVHLFHPFAEEDNSIPWIERVPSQSNIADLPSRDCTSEVFEIIHGQPWPSVLPVEMVAQLCSSFQAL